jgi:hypothetical protein
MSTTPPAPGQSTDRPAPGAQSGADDRVARTGLVVYFVILMVLLLVFVAFSCNALAQPVQPIA